MILGIIPARLKSKRLPNKPLQTIDGLPLLVHVLKRSLMSKKLDKLVVCTDSLKVVNLVKKYGQDAYLTSKNIKNGSDRISTFLKKNSRKFKNLKLVVDIQCDEIFLNPTYLDKAINFHLKNLKKYHGELHREEVAIYARAAVHHHFTGRRDDLHPGPEAQIVGCGS